MRIEIDDGLAESEVIIRCPAMDEGVQRIQKFVSEQGGPAPKLVFYKDGQEFYFPQDKVLFFETEGEVVFAHTEADAFRTRFRLYELEDLLPAHFIRVSKSTIVNLNRIYSIKRDLTASSLVEFTGTHKHIYVSRRYYAALRDRLDERSKGR